MTAKIPLQRSTVTRVLRATLGALWFEFWFFVAFPAGLLLASGTPLVPEPGLGTIPGGLLLLGAHALLAVTIASFLRTGGTHLPFDPPTELVRQGLYGRIRNPMYCAYVAIAVGEALVYGSLALGAYAVALWALIQFYLLRVEEPGLRARFGDPYDDYCRSTGRWLPARSAASQLAGRGSG